MCLSGNPPTKLLHTHSDSGSPQASCARLKPCCGDRVVTPATLGRCVYLWWEVFLRHSVGFIWCTDYIKMYRLSHVVQYNMNVFFVFFYRSEIWQSTVLKAIAFWYSVQRDTAYLTPALLSTDLPCTGIPLTEEQLTAVAALHCSVSESLCSSLDQCRSALWTQGRGCHWEGYRLGQQFNSQSLALEACQTRVVFSSEKMSEFEWCCVKISLKDPLKQIPWFASQYIIYVWNEFLKACAKRKNFVALKCEVRPLYNFSSVFSSGFV